VACADNAACLGIFGVVGYGVTLRTKEIGIRMALGADRSSILGLLLRQLACPAALGLVLGVVSSLPIAMLLAGQPFYLRLDDPSVYAAALILLTARAGSPHCCRPAARFEEIRSRACGISSPSIANVITWCILCAFTHCFRSA